MNLSPNFTLAEFTASDTAARHGVDNTPREADILANLRRTAAVMEEIRLILGVPVLVNSGYRCQALNDLVKGSDTSAHLFGLACDFIAPKFGVPYDVARAIEPHVARLDLDQLLYEYTWVHIGLRHSGARHEVKTLGSGGRFVAGIVLQGSVA